MKDLGVLVPIVTPVSADGRPDMDGMRTVCDDMMRVGAQSLFVMGSTGRGPWFSRDDQAAVCRTVANHVGGEVVIFGGCMATGLPGMLENARVMADAGARIAVATAPAYFHYTQSEVERIFAAFADASPLPVMVYDIPAFAGMKLDLDLVRRLGAHENIVGFKDSSGDFERFKDLADALSGRDDFYLLQGKEEYLADSLRIGASGFVVSFVHFEPRTFVDLYRAVRAGDDAAADAEQEKVNALCRIIRPLEQAVPETSRLFYLLTGLLHRRGVDVNILLSHETGPCEAVARAIEEIADVLGV